jgi:hypothetical protein
VFNLTCLGWIETIIEEMIERIESGTVALDGIKLVMCCDLCLCASCPCVYIQRINGYM